LREVFLLSRSARSLRRKNHTQWRRAGENYNQILNMSTLIAKGNWNIIKGKLKQRFARLMEDDLQFSDGKVDELVGRIQKRTGLTRKGIEPSTCEGDTCGCRQH
jgi:uncharacterized protein YjbJ (UPF0337 family)